jgi:hypothetical protein
MHYVGELNDQVNEGTILGNGVIVYIPFWVKKL